MRLATLAPQGRISTDLVRAEIARLQYLWAEDDSGQAAQAVFRLPEHIRREDWDLFDLQQLENVLAICRQSKNMAEAGRALFNVSRNSRSTPNDSDRLRKYLARFGLTWADAVA